MPSAGLNSATGESGKRSKSAADAAGSWVRVNGSMMTFALAAEGARTGGGQQSRSNGSHRVSLPDTATGDGRSVASLKSRGSRGQPIMVRVLRQEMLACHRHFSARSIDFGCGCESLSFAWPSGACVFSGLAHAKDACESAAS